MTYLLNNWDGGNDLVILAAALKPSLPFSARGHGKALAGFRY